MRIACKGNISLRIKKIFKEDEIQYLENLWKIHNLDVEEGWNKMSTDNDIFRDVVNNNLWAYYASSGLVLGDAEDRVKEIFAERENNK